MILKIALYNIELQQSRKDAGKYLSILQLGNSCYAAHSEWHFNKNY